MYFFFFFQAEDGIRDIGVTGVQTCALPIYNHKKVDLLFIAVNDDFACSKSSFSSIVPKQQLIFYKNDTVPVKPIIDYLKSIDREMIERKVNDPNLIIELGKEDDDNDSVISISEIAQKYSIPAEVARRISLRDNKEKYIEAGMHLIPKSKAHVLESIDRKSVV